MAVKIGAMVPACRAFVAAQYGHVSVTTSVRRHPRKQRGLVTDFVKIEKGHGPEGRIAMVRSDRGDRARVCVRETAAIRLGRQQLTPAEQGAASPMNLLARDRHKDWR